MIPISRLQAYLRHSAQQQYETVSIPPFTLFFHPSDPFPYFNYAIPDEPVTGDQREPLEKLRAAFQSRDRQPAADERAGRVYERVGFRPYATMLAYIASPHP
ncbi:MAG: hypothetical protein M3220_19230 [Chloroflexota bacterium]|nr:hypothetical protein [Chloroflexota bacterium]